MILRKIGRYLPSYTASHSRRKILNRHRQSIHSPNFVIKIDAIEDTRLKKVLKKQIFFFEPTQFFFTGRIESAVRRCRWKITAGR